MLSRRLSQLLGVLLLTCIFVSSNKAEDRLPVKRRPAPPPEELAQTSGLKWLVAQQQADGSWESDQVVDPKTKKEQVRLGRNGATALALLTLYSNGHTSHDKTEFHAACKKALDYLIAHAKSEGAEKYSWADPEGGQLSHALAAMFLCDAYGMTKDKALLEYAQGGLNYISATTDEKRPGWGVLPGDGPNLEVTVWQTMALKTGAMSYLTVNPNTVKTVVAALNQMVPADADYSKIPAADLSQAIIARIHLGWKYDNQGIQNTIPVLGKYKPESGEPATNYYVGRVLYLLDNDTRKAWQEIMPPVILAGQQKGDNLPNQLPPLLLPGQKQTEDLTGSWPPGKSSSTTRLGQNRFEATCLNLLTLGYAKAPGRKHDWVLKRETEVDESFPL